MRLGASPAHGRLSRNPLFRSNRQLAIVDVDLNVNVHVAGQAYENHFGRQIFGRLYAYDETFASTTTSTTVQIELRDRY